MFLKNLIVAGLLCLCCSVSAKSTYLIVQMNDSTTQSFILDKRPNLTFSDDNLLVTGEVEATFLRSEIYNLHFADLERTTTPKIENNEVRVMYTDNQNVVISGLTAGTTASLLSVDGKILASTVANTNSVSFTLPNEKGVYVLKFNNQSVKVLKK